MKNYTVIAPTGVTLHSGILALTPAQALPRAHALSDLGDGFYGIPAPVCFKRGEAFGYDGDVNKSLLEQMLPAEEVPAEEVPAEEAPAPRTRKR